MPATSPASAPAPDPAATSPEASASPAVTPAPPGAQEAGNDGTVWNTINPGVEAAEIDKYEGDEAKKEDEEKKYLDVISNKNIKLSERILIPVQQYPKLWAAEACCARQCKRGIRDLLLLPASKATS
ncbi:UNVERIFIED_CONTAM: hypothetical protein FKN15_051008 [Acipenser sinensis]